MDCNHSNELDIPGIVSTMSFWTINKHFTNLVLDRAVGFVYPDWMAEQMDVLWEEYVIKN